MALKVAVLGTSGGYPGPGRACPGFLLELGEQNLVLDLGSGALANLLRHIEADEVMGLALTHAHYDHYVDIYGLCTARRFWEVQLEPLLVFAPAGAKKVIGSPLSDGSRPKFFECMELEELEGDSRFEVGEFKVLARPGSHVIASYIYRVEAAGRAICYSGDTDVSDTLVEQARGCDLFICESTFTSEVDAKMAGHLFAAEAGRVAQEAGAKRLLLTHVWPTLSRERAVADASAEFDGPVEAAAEGMILEP